MSAIQFYQNSDQTDCHCNAVVVMLLHSTGQENMIESW